MTIKSKINKLRTHPAAFIDYLKGICPDHTISFLTARKIIDEEIKTFIDVGANKGRFSKAGYYHNPEMKTIAFEPIPNISEFKGKTWFYEIGLSNKKEKIDFYINEVIDAWSTFHKPIENHSKDFSSIENFKKTKVRLDRFDNLDIEIKRPCFLKVDVEGHEHEVLEGFGERLNEIDVIQIEQCFRDYFSNQKDIGNTFNLLKQYGFNGIIQLNVRHIEDKLTFCDWMFFRIKENGKQQ